ncbi:hypothetical protein GYMLUDRAFT_176346 [Collybiopsis luxurians FD-317 M1]|uniref:Cytochrome P450 n=1 Tax=Collybiopsis luxurians FD-317 M1 TaxID=944289 RepID=A0A0D0CJ26_9AGAR|nr:hypothetical protein GYMLUDRAFT_176346 [Collybiopsis luxurians FD-317 M1]
MHIVLTSLTLFYFAALALYRIFFHPLRSYPGPVLAAVTDWYQVYYNILQGGALVTEIERLHKCYGPVVRVGPNTLHFNDRVAYHDIYSRGTTLTKEPHFYSGFLAHAPESSMVFSDPQKARHRRNLLAPSFSRQAVMKLEYTIQKKVDQLVALLEENYNSLDSSVTMAFAYRSLTTDIITEYCFANSTNTLADPNLSHPLVLETRNLVRRAWIQIYFPFTIHLTTSLPKKLILWLFPNFTTIMDVQEKFERQIDNFISHPDVRSTIEHETIYHYLLEPKDPGSRPSKKALVDEAFELLGAGSDTVGHACTIGTYFALQEVSISRRLVEELKEAWPDKGRPMSFTALEKLPYLTAFVKESLRMSIGAMHPMPRVVGDETPEIAGLNIPSGTIVAMSSFFMLMNPEVFDNPDTFDPDRWLAENTSEMMADFVPFGKGPRQCLAWSELYLIFGNIFRKLDLSLVGVNEYVFFTLNLKT